ncbi:RagB/SusD family nutrient uptake outer membrane protein [Chitinophaga filiformis]|uniref:Cna protein B-type domain-containing protein n=1 Tax=Chitinophaga filiformis TaxID=104663 RepID=A0A1G7JX42_CHIFI|nr:RagB/SusD family nutrient uptake outer membrane protein [Chitinophaga filiformis]SDF29527.1 Cna protein B-type domain-containing protein [Chitinophaga filiformis]
MKRLLFLALSCSLWACKDDEVTPNVQPSNKTTASVTVWDTKQWSPEQPKGVLSEGATVALYTSQQDYLSQKPAFTATTNASGVAEFGNIPEGEYFMVASKNGMTNTWRDAQGMTRVSDTLFQTEAEINDPTQPIQENALPGDFKYRDLNGDGMINNNDVAEAPFFTFVVKKDSANKTRALIGSNVNHAYGTAAAVEEAFSLEYQKISAAHQQMVMIDGILSDEADCQFANLPASWCELNNFTFTAANSIVESAWKSHYTSIFHLNRMLASLNGIQGDVTALRAQIRSFRAYLYLQLYTYFGNLPTTDKLLMPSGISRGSDIETRIFIKNELKASLVGLTDEVPANKPWYMRAAGVYMMLARLAVMERDSQSAIDYTGKVIATHMYALADSAAVFTAPASSEIIWNMTASMTSPFKDYFIRGGLKVDFCPTIRYTETYLLNAWANLFYGEYGEANKALNTVRTRGKKLPVTLTTAEALFNEFDALCKEELYREGYRFANLVIFQKATAVLGSKGYQDKHAHLPIPTSVLDTYPNLVQNVGY